MPNNIVSVSKPAYSKLDVVSPSFLMASILSAMGYDVVLLEFPTHVAVGINMEYEIPDGYYYEYAGKNYYFLETTTYYEIGEAPEPYIGESAIIHPIY